MKKLILAALTAILAIGAATAQVTNRCLKFEEGGTVDCGPLPGNRELTSYTIQFWMKPTDWRYRQAIIKRGNDFQVFLGVPANGAIFLKVGDIELRLLSAFKQDEWNHVTFIVDEGKPSAYINGKSVPITNETNVIPRVDYNGATNTFAEKREMPAIPFDSTFKQHMFLGGTVVNNGNQYAGYLDEVRIWGCALPNEFELFTFNTLNKFAPCWDDLLVYYKMDQPAEKTGKEQFFEKYLVDYKGFISSPNAPFNSHGKLGDGVTFVNSDNDKLPYLFHGAYTEDARFFDRIIPRDQYLLSNHLQILGANIDPDKGTCVLRTPNTHATVYKATIEADAARNTNVISLTGEEDSYIELPAETLSVGSFTANQTVKKGFAFETWLWLDEWPAYDEIPDDDTENIEEDDKAYLLRKETVTDDGQLQGIAVYLGREKGKIITRINGTKFVHRFDEIEPGKWVYFAICPDMDNEGQLLAYAGKNTVTYSFNNKTGTLTTAFDNENTPTVIGKNLKCKLDNTVMWTRSWKVGTFQTHMNGNGLMPKIGEGVNNLTFGDVFLRYDDADRPGYNSFSNDEWLRIMKSAYEGYAGYKITLTVRGETPSSSADYVTGDDGNQHPKWWTVFSDLDKRKQFVTDFVRFSEPYDGLEFDCEWDNAWFQLSMAAVDLKNALNALDPSKTVRVSCHSKYYSIGNGNKQHDILDGFTFQMYGPDANLYSYSDKANSFTKSITAFQNQKFPDNKILTSYATTTNNGAGLQNGKILETAGYKFEGVEKEADQYSVTINGKEHQYISPGNAYKRALYTRQQGLGGIFYWDMGNEYWGNYTDEASGSPETGLLQTYGADIQEATPAMPKYNLAKYANYAISSNVDPIMTEENVKLNHYDGSLSGVEEVSAESVDPNAVTVYPSPATDRVTVKIGGQPASDVTFYSASGAAVLTASSSVIDVAGLPSGIYIAVAQDEDGNSGQCKFNKK